MSWKWSKVGRVWSQSLDEEDIHDILKTPQSDKGTEGMDQRAQSKINKIRSKYASLVFSECKEDPDLEKSVSDRSPMSMQKKI